MKRPIIGVMPLMDYEKESYWMLPGYMRGIEMAGGIPIMLPLSAQGDVVLQMVQICSGFLFTGGQDVSPAVYGAARAKQCGEICEVRDEMEKQYLLHACKMDKPVFGICRGIQFINAALGGTLYQDIPAQCTSPLEHHQSPPYDVPCHAVTILKGSPLYTLLQKDSLLVNSYHHQAIRDLAPVCEAMAYSPDGFVEAIRVKEKRFIWAVQWHPEFNYMVEESSRQLFSEFVRQCTVAPG